jgi:cellulose synthase/poly-beta-1,6-N-acetylglucosamine synthase-like glycosyltransferase
MVELMAQTLSGLGVVVIGRNEGDRLLRCLKSVLPYSAHVVYVDSGSRDDSVAQAKKLGVDVVALDMTQPFTAARARNAGMWQLETSMPQVDCVQFVDGDCEVRDTWLETAWRFLQQRSDVVAVCGRRRERFPEHSLYNRMCDAEWDTPIGEAKACGGDVMLRAAAFTGVGGFRDELIAGEEPELCLRLRAAGGKIWRLDNEMTWHDAAILRFSSWWRRTARGGYAFAEGAFLHGAPPERHWVQETRRIWMWGMLIPVLTGVLTAMFGGWMLSGLLLYPVQVVRLGWRNRQRGLLQPWRMGGLMVIGKFAELTGALTFYYRRLLRQRGQLIEYK